MTPPPTIAHYRIVSKVGEGGMGAVYRATDTRLNRDVAIKILPPAFAEDAARMARFEREAQVLASLNHPNIAAIYGIEQSALVMELVEGEELKGPLPADTVIDYARQIAAGLEAAHERGIVHRDLKPANIKVIPDGVVKLLDFGLARATGETASASAVASPTISPTLSLSMTQAGMILGTAAYMSPEQARGRIVEQRADIWAFGVILFELLSGAMLFGGGETVSDSLAAVLTREPDYNALPKDTPPRLRKLIERCLRKDQKQRLRDIGDARLMLEEAETVVAALPLNAPPQRARVPWAAAAICFGALLAMTALWWRASQPTPRPLMRFTADMGPDALAGQRVTAAISPDGTRLAYPVRSGSEEMLATRLLDQSRETLLPGTEKASDPFFSPDGQWIGFFTGTHLKKVSIQGGAPITLCEQAGVRGGHWDEDGTIVFGSTSGSGLWRVPGDGGEARVLTRPADKGDLSHRWPQPLPGGEAILFTGHDIGTNFDAANIEVLSLKTGQSKVVQTGGYYGRYLPSGHLVYLNQGTLFAVPFNPKTFEKRGAPVPVLEDVAGHTTSGGGQLNYARNGTLVYLAGKASAGARTFYWVDASGKTETLLTAPMILNPRLSPDGKRLATGVIQAVLVHDLVRGSVTRIPTGATLSATVPAWMPDGKHLIYSSPSGRAIWLASADGSDQPQVLYETKAGYLNLGEVSPDGRTVAFLMTGNTVNRDLWTLPLDTTDPRHPKAGTPQVFVANKGLIYSASFSPDGHWLAYTSFETNNTKTFVRPFPENSNGPGQVQITADFGRDARWSRTAKEIFYLEPGGNVMVVPYTVREGVLEPGKPRRWTNVQVGTGQTNLNYDLAPDGKRIAAGLGPQGASEGGKSNLHLTFLLNFFDELKRRVP